MRLNGTADNVTNIGTARSITCLSLLLFFMCLAPLTASAQIVGIAGDSVINRCETKSYTISTQNDSGNILTDVAIVAKLENLTGFSYVNGTSSLDINGGAPFCTNDPVIGGGYSGQCAPVPGGAFLTWDIDGSCGVQTLADGDTLNITFQLKTDCTAVSGSLNTYLDYQINGTPDCDAAGVLNIQVTPGAVTIKKTPNVIPQVLGQNVTWTLTVENTGFGVVKNVEVSDVLGTGLAYVSSTPNGNNNGQITTWTSGEYAGLASMNPGDILTMDITAAVIACDNLDNEANVRFGCEPGPSGTCFDTSVDGGTAGSSVQRISRTPVVSFTPPDVSFTYCSGSENISFTIANTGDGIAHDVYVIVDFGDLTVSNVSAGAVYNTADKRFELAVPLAPGDSYNLSFDLASTTWCGGFPSGDLLWQKFYKDECGREFYPTVELSTINSPASSSDLSVVIGGAPEVIDLSAPVTYTVTSSYTGPVNCGGGQTGTITVVDTVPNGFTVTNAGGGVWAPGGGGTGVTVTWTYMPPASLNTVIVLESPPTAQCETYCNTVFTNTITADGTDCCGCALHSSDSKTTAMECAEGVTSDKTSSSPTERCDDTTYTNTYAFSGGSGVVLSDLQFEEHAELQQEYNGNLSVIVDGGDVTGCVAVTDNTPGGGLLLDFSGCGATSLAGKTLTITYDLTATANTAAACGAGSLYSWSSLDMGPTGSSCLGDGVIHEAAVVNIVSPSMSLSITGLGDTFHTCETKTITITLTQTSAASSPRDVQLALSGLNYFVVNPAAVICGGVSPVSCTPVMDGNGDYVWTFNDAFTGAGQSAVVQLDVRKRCGGTGDLAAAAYYDDRCTDDATLDKLCSAATVETPSLLLTGELLIEKTPEIYYADSDIVQWEIYVTNRGTGTAYNVWIDDVLGGGLIYEHGVNPVAVDNMTGVTVNDSLDHNGGAVNGASVEISSMAAGERRRITFIAKQVGCTGLTNDVTSNWGCVGVDCQTDVSDSSIVSIPAPNLINTITSYSGVNICSSPGGVITIRNPGQLACYNLQVTETLPAGLPYVPGSTRWRLNGGAWNGPNAAYDPNPTNSPLVWTDTEIPGLAAVVPGDTIEIEFGMTADCPFSGGDITVSTQYENSCAGVFTAADNTFTAALNAPDVEITTTADKSVAGCGDTITWTIDVTNNGAYTLPILWLEDTLGDSYTPGSISAGGDASYTGDNGTVNGRIVTWEITNLPAGATATVTVTADTDSAPCAGNLENTVLGWFGCGAADGLSTTKPGVDAPDNTLCLSSSLSASATDTPTRQPQLDVQSITMNPVTIDTCNDGTELTVVLENTGPTDASSVDLEITLPPGLTYNSSSAEIGLGTDSSVIPSGSADPAVAGSVLTFYDTGDKGNNIADAIQADGGNDTLVLKFSVRSACYSTADVDFTIRYYDCCDDNQYSTTARQQLTALSPGLAITKTPVDSHVSCGSQQSWTITVINNGTGNAQVVRIEDGPGAWIDVRTGQPGDPVDMGGGVYGWEINNLAAGGGQVFTLTGTLNPDGLPNQADCTAAWRRNIVAAVWGCGTGGDAIDNDPTTTVDYDCENSTPANAPAATLQMPDLLITDMNVATDCTAAGDGNFAGAVEVTVENQGDGDSLSEFTIQVTTGGGTWTETVGPLAAGASRTVSVDTPGWNPGCNGCADYALDGYVDLDSEVCECNESNNGYSGTGPAQIPDLTVTDIDFSNMSCVNDTITGNVRVRVENVGCAASSDFQVSLATDGCLSFANRTVAAPAPGASTIAVFPINDSWATCADGDCLFTAAADADDDLCECDGTNNTRTETNPPFRAKIYWSDETASMIQGADRDNGSIQNIVDAADGLNGPRGIAVDEILAELYWVNGGSGTIQKADLDGANVRETVTGLTSPVDIALDRAGGKMYWSDDGDNALYRADMDGAGQEAIVTGLSGVRCLALDVVAGKLYWTNPADGRINRADLNGGNQEVLIGAGLTAPFGIALDLTGSKIYFSDPGAGKIQRANLADGSVVEDVVSGLGINVGRLAVDEAEELIYFATNGTAIRRVGFDGSGLQDVATGLNNGTGTALYTPLPGCEFFELAVNSVTPIVSRDNQGVLSGSVTVNVSNTGQNDAVNAGVRLTSDCGIVFPDQNVNLDASANQDVIFSYTPDCTNDACIFTAEIDPDNTFCECSNDNNTLAAAPYALTLPDMVVKGGDPSILIPNGDVSPGTTDGTVFGPVNPGNTVVHAFTIENSGQDALTLSGSPLVHLSDTANFAVTIPPGSTVDADGGTTVFVVSYNPTGTGTHNATVTVVNDDCDDNPYVFAVTGTGIVDDGDGVPDDEESGPNQDDPDYDGNNDGVPDNAQADVASVQSAGGECYVTVAASGGHPLGNVDGVTNPSPGNAPAGITFPCGFFEFTVNGLTNGEAVTVTLYLPAGATCSTYWKYGPTPGNPAPHWYEFMFDGQTGAQITGNIIVLYFVDGLRGDDDLTANGEIVDQGAPGVHAQAQQGEHIPSLTKWGVIIFVVLLLCSVSIVIRRNYSQ